MNCLDILNPENDLELTLCKPNKLEIGILSTAKITSIKIEIDVVNSINFEIPNVINDRFSRENVINPLYNEIHEERLIRLNDSYFVIKSIDEENGYVNKKMIEAYSLEHKLNRINLKLEDVAIVLFKEDVEDKEVAIFERLYSETGWNIGHVDELVRFDIVNGEKVKKIRWQESVSDNWYNFLTETIADVFNCVCDFNTDNKVINLYSLDTLGENIGLYLSHDNYIKNIKKQSNTENIVTRLSLTGKDEIDIRDVNPLGKDYVEDYSYFINNDDMSDELSNALKTHDEIVKENQETWSVLVKDKNNKDKDLITKSSEFKNVCEKINVLESIKENNPENSDETQAEIDKYTILRDKLEEEIRVLELEIVEINIKIQEINKQMDRIYAVDNNGNQLFPNELLSELNEFLYYDTYSNSAYLTSKDLMDGGKRELGRRCIPTIEYSIDSINFMSRVLNNKSMNFNGVLNLGDIVILYDEEKEEEILLYFVGYELNPTDNSLNISISNKKTKINNTKSISDYLNKAKSSKQFVDSKSYLINQIKYNKI